VVLNKRERIIAIALGAAVALLVADTYLLTPYVEERSRISDDRDVVEGKLANAQKLLNSRKAVERNWALRVSQGLKSDPAAAETQALHALRDWAQNARIDLQSLKTDRASRSGDFLQIRLQATGAGRAASIASFLRQVETATIPLRIIDFHANARKEGTDDVTFNISVSTILRARADLRRQVHDSSVRQ
jgi:hypothetical protein